MWSGLHLFIEVASHLRWVPFWNYRPFSVRQIWAPPTHFLFETVMSRGPGGTPRVSPAKMAAPSRRIRLVRPSAPTFPASTSRGVQVQARN